MIQTFGDTFHIGCNYWASHAGCWMWQQWDENEVAADLDALLAHGLTTLRVFPLWPDFQPLRVLSGAYGAAEHVGLEDGVQTSPVFEPAGIDATMMARFERFCAMVEARGMQLTVMMLTGWMSGGQFRPEPLINRNVFTDPFALRWQVRFVKCFVEHFRNTSAIKAWGLGNECNIMSPCGSADAAYVWTTLIADAIRSVDPSRPVISGMHGLTLSAPENSWRIEDQGEACDILTTHPYPLFIRYCQDEPLNSFRNSLLAICESTLYSDLSGRPCLCEEVSDFGRNVSSEETSRVYARTLLWSCWANDNLGCLWWCGFELDRVKRFPYDRFVFEQGLGVLTSDRQPKAVALAYQQFSEAIDALPPEYQRLKSRTRDAVCILTPGQDTWAVALAAFMLAKQAGFDVRFVDGRKPLPQASVYLMPSVAGYAPLAGGSWDYLFEQVRENGAVLYVSILDGAIPDLERFAGLQVENRMPWHGHATARFTDDDSTICLSAVGGARAADSHGASQSQSRPLRFIVRPSGADVLAEDADARPIFTRYQLGRGYVYFLNYGLEASLAQLPMSLDAEADDYARFYRTFASDLLDRRAVRKPVDVHALVLTEHRMPDDRIVTVAVNHGSARIETQLAMNPSVEDFRILSGSGTMSGGNQLQIMLEAGDAIIIETSHVAISNDDANNAVNGLHDVFRDSGSVPSNQASVLVTDE